LIAGFDEDFFDFAVLICINAGFHFHGFQRQQYVAFLDLITDLDVHGDNGTRHGCCHLTRCTSCDRACGTVSGGMSVLNNHISRLPVQLKEHRPAAFGIRIRDRQQADDEPFACINFNRELFTDFWAVKEHRGWQQ